MSWKFLDEKTSSYFFLIKKLGNLNLLVEAKKAQEDASVANKKARLLYQNFIKSNKED